MGLAVRPPHYANTPQLILHDVFSLSFYVLIAWLVSFVQLDGPFPLATIGWIVLLVAVVASVYGYLRKWYYRAAARKHSLSSWEVLQ